MMYNGSNSTGRARQSQQHQQHQTQQSGQQMSVMQQQQQQHQQHQHMLWQQQQQRQHQQQRLAHQAQHAQQLQRLQQQQLSAWNQLEPIPFRHSGVAPHLASRQHVSQPAATAAAAATAAPPLQPSPQARHSLPPLRQQVQQQVPIQPSQQKTIFGLWRQEVHQTRLPLERSEEIRLLARNIPQHDKIALKHLTVTVFVERPFVAASDPPTTLTRDGTFVWNSFSSRYPAFSHSLRFQEVVGLSCTHCAWASCHCFVILSNKQTLTTSMSIGMAALRSHLATCPRVPRADQLELAKTFDVDPINGLSNFFLLWYTLIRESMHSKTPAKAAAASGHQAKPPSNRSTSLAMSNPQRLGGKNLSRMRASHAAREYKQRDATAMKAVTTKPVPAASPTAVGGTATMPIEIGVNQTAPPTTKIAPPVVEAAAKKPTKMYDIKAVLPSEDEFSHQWAQSQIFLQRLKQGKEVSIDCVDLPTSMIMESVQFEVFLQTFCLQISTPASVSNDRQQKAQTGRAIDVDAIHQQSDQTQVSALCSQQKEHTSVEVKVPSIIDQPCDKQAEKVSAQLEEQNSTNIGQEQSCDEQVDTEKVDKEVVQIEVQDSSNSYQRQPCDEQVDMETTEKEAAKLEVQDPNNATQDQPCDEQIEMGTIDNASAQVKTLSIGRGNPLQEKADSTKMGYRQDTKDDHGLPRTKSTSQYCISLLCVYCQGQGKNGAIILASVSSDDKNDSDQTECFEKRAREACLLHTQMCPKMPRYVTKQLGRRTPDPKFGSQLDVCIRDWNKNLTNLLVGPKLRSTVPTEHSSEVPAPSSLLESSKQASIHSHGSDFSADLYRPLRIHEIIEHKTDAHLWGPSKLMGVLTKNKTSCDHVSRLNLSRNDVVIDCEFCMHRHEGNRRFRNLISTHRSFYRSLTSEARMEIVATTLLKVVQTNRRGNFVEAIPSTDSAQVYWSKEKATKFIHKVLKRGFPELMRLPIDKTVTGAGCRVMDLEVVAQKGICHGQMKLPQALDEITSTSRFLSVRNVHPNPPSTYVTPQSTTPNLPPDQINKSAKQQGHISFDLEIPLGIRFRTYPGREYGVYIHSILKHGSAARNGTLKEGDILVQLGSQQARNFSLSDIEQSAKAFVGKTIRVVFFRNPNLEPWNTAAIVNKQRAQSNVTNETAKASMLSNDIAKHSAGSAPRSLPNMREQSSVGERASSSTVASSSAEGYSPNQNGEERFAVSLKLPMGLRLVHSMHGGGRLTVLELNPLGCAMKSGKIRVGDQLVKVDTENVIGLPLNEAMDMILERGKSGPVTLEICRPKKGAGDSALTSTSSLVTTADDSVYGCVNRWFTIRMQLPMGIVLGYYSEGSGGLYVRDFSAAGYASTLKSLRKGDFLVRVDGKNILGYTVARAKGLISKKQQADARRRVEVEFFRGDVEYLHRTVANGATIVTPNSSSAESASSKSRISPELNLASRTLPGEVATGTKRSSVVIDLSDTEPVKKQKLTELRPGYDLANYFAIQLKLPMGLIFEENSLPFNGARVARFLPDGKAIKMKMLALNDQLVAIESTLVRGLTLRSIVDVMEDHHKGKYMCMIFFRGNVKDLHPPHGPDAKWLQEEVGTSVVVHAF